jgi:D-serine deaminase-like pyridoxal phosphate-dependent protein
MAKPGIPYASLDTPAVLVDMDKLEANIQEAQRLAAIGDVKVRPHNKSHECAEIARMQIKAGAIGVSSAKLEEATRMAEEGIENIMILHPFYGDHKLEKLKKLVSRPGLKLSCVVDMIEHAEAISQVGQAVGQKIPVLLKIDTGVKRFGVLPGEPALNRAREIKQIPGIELVGIASHESSHGERTREGVDRVCREVPALLAATARLLRNNGIDIMDVALGSTPSLRNVGMLKDYPEITEIHPGMYIFGDMMYVSNFAMTEEQCSLTVLSTVIGTSETPPPRAVIDAGGKTFTPDALMHLRNEPGYLWEGKPRFGPVRGRPDLWFGRLPAENGVLYFTDPDKRVSLGERLEIIPNNASMVVAIHDQIYGVRKGEVERTFKITGRGLGN